MIHSVSYFCTASSGLSTFPEFFAVVMLEEVQIGYSDSNIQRILLKQAWMEQLERDHPDEVKRYTGMVLGHQQTLKVQFETLMKRFNQTGGKFISTQWLFVRRP